MNFTDLGLIDPLCKALTKSEYTEATPIQIQAIPSALKGLDVLGIAQTGTGKTAAFLLPILQRLMLETNSQKISSLILAPTRELAVQIGDSLKVYGEFTRQKYVIIYGGVSQRNQEMALRGKIDIVIATPGRLLDLLNQKVFSLSHVKTFVLDEADKMLNMGFIDDVKRIIAKIPKNRQTLFFSATMPKEIQKLADEILHKPVRVEVARVSSVGEKIEQEVYFVNKENKKRLLLHLLENSDFKKILIFTKMKHSANRLSLDLVANKISAEAIHGNKSQNNRLRALDNFRSGKIKVLVATDIASRGIDIDDISHVINYELPIEEESYVHRIGRTGRAGRSGKAISFCDPEEAKILKAIEKLITKPIPVNMGNPFPYDKKIVSVEKEGYKTNNPNRNSSRPKNPNGAKNSYFSRHRKKK